MLTDAVNGQACEEDRHAHAALAALLLVPRLSAFSAEAVVTGSSRGMRSAFAGTLVRLRAHVWFHAYDQPRRTGPFAPGAGSTLGRGRPYDGLPYPRLRPVRPRME